MIEDEDIEIEDTQREDRHDLMMRLLMWREKHINEHNFVLILSFIIGTTVANIAFQCRQRQLSLSHIPDNRYFIGRLVRTLHCKRRYQSWCHPHTLCHIAKEKPA